MPFTIYGVSDGDKSTILLGDSNPSAGKSGVSNIDGTKIYDKPLTPGEMKYLHDEEGGNITPYNEVNSSATYSSGTTVEDEVSSYFGSSSSGTQKATLANGAEKQVY